MACTWPIEFSFLVYLCVLSIFQMAQNLSDDKTTVKITTIWQILSSYNDHLSDSDHETDYRIEIENSNFPLSDGDDAENSSNTRSLSLQKTVLPEFPKCHHNIPQKLLPKIL